MSTGINKWLILGALLVVTAIGCRSPNRRTSGWPGNTANNATYTPREEPTSSYAGPVADQWVCPMHPQVRQSGPGKCSICGMDLVRSSEPASGGEASSGSGRSRSSGSGCSHCGSS